MCVDMANMMIHGTSELEVAKKVICLLVMDAQDYKKDASNGYQSKQSKRLQHDEVQCKTEETNTSRTELST